MIEDIYKSQSSTLVPAIALKGQQYQSQGNYAMANKCFLKAAKQGDGGSLYNLGVNYDAGHGVTQDSAKAADFYQACLSISDDPLAMCNLGVHSIAMAPVVLNRSTWHDFGGKKAVPCWKRTVLLA